MKRIVSLISIALVAIAAISCNKVDLTPNSVKIMVVNSESKAIEAEGIEVTLADAAKTEYVAATNASGIAEFLVPAGSYTATVASSISADGVKMVLNGSGSITVQKDLRNEYTVTVSVAESQQIIIKEFYFGGCPQNTGTAAYMNDAYVVLYNNSEIEADASNIVFTFAAPYNSNGTNKYYSGDVLGYEREGWLPAYGAIWWFQTEVKIPAYSQIVVAIYGGIDHTKTYEKSVNLANANYYVMSNEGIAQYTNAKYAKSDVIPASHNLTCNPFTQGNAWALSNTCPAFYIARMTREEANALSTNSAEFDHTMGTSAAFNVAKMPQSAVVDAVEVFNAAQATNNLRFPSSINTEAVKFTNKLGYTVYRNVDKAATEALPENAGKLVYNYAGGTESETNGSTDASKIDAEASIKAGAHIIFSDTNNSKNDFHQRKVAALK